MIELLIGIIIAAVVFFIAREVIGMLGFDPAITKIIYMVLGLIFLLWLLNFLGVTSFSLR